MNVPTTLSLGLLAPLLLTIGASGCSDSSRTDSAASPSSGEKKPARGSGPAVADEHVRFTISGPGLERTTYRFDPAAFTITSGGNSALIRAMRLNAQDGTAFLSLQLGVSGVPGPGTYSSRDRKVVASWAFTPVAGENDRAMSESHEKDFVLILTSHTDNDDHVAATFSGTVEQTNNRAKPSYTIEDGSLLVRRRK